MWHVTRDTWHVTRDIWHMTPTQHPPHTHTHPTQNLGGCEEDLSNGRKCLLHRGHTDIQTYRQTDIATLRLNRPSGPMQWKSLNRQLRLLCFAKILLFCCCLGSPFLDNFDHISCSHFWQTWCSQAVLQTTPILVGSWQRDGFCKVVELAHRGSGIPKLPLLADSWLNCTTVNVYFQKFYF